MDELELSLLLRNQGYDNVPSLNKRFETHLIKQNLLHLQTRSLSVEKYPSIVVLTDVIIFPLWNLSGQYVGYQQYRPNTDKKKKNNPREGRYYTSLHGKWYEKPLGIWGLESYHYRDDILFICEGIFDACRLHNLGLPAVALLNSSHTHFKNWLTSTGRKIYKVEDKAGSRLGPYENVSLPEYRDDLGECTDGEIILSLSETALSSSKKEMEAVIHNMIYSERLNKDLAKIMYDNLCGVDSG